MQASSSYDINYLPEPREQKSLDYQFDELDTQEEVAIVTIAKASSKVLRLYKQKAFLKKRYRDILRRGLRTLDKLNTQERKEKEEEERVCQEETDCLLSRSVENPCPDYDPTLTARLINLPADNPLQLSNFDSYTLPIGYDSYATLDSVLVILGSHSRTPLASQGS